MQVRKKEFAVKMMPMPPALLLGSNHQVDVEEPELMEVLVVPSKVTIAQNVVIDYDVTVLEEWLPVKGSYL